MLNEILKSGIEHPRSYLVKGEKENIIPEIFNVIEKEWGITAQGNPNILKIDSHMGVDEARQVQEFASLSPFGDDALKVILLSAERVTREAQNVLLKLTEEPNKSLRIFIIVPKDVELLPTLLSRLEDISFAFENSGATPKTEAGNFLYMGLKERFKLAEKIAKDEDETALDTFLRDLEKKIFKQKFPDTSIREKALSAISFAKTAAGTQGRPKRMILETLSISLPVL